MQVLFEFGSGKWGNRVQEDPFVLSYYFGTGSYLGFCVGGGAAKAVPIKEGGGGWAGPLFAKNVVYIFKSRILVKNIIQIIGHKYYFFLNSW